MTNSRTAAHNVHNTYIFTLFYWAARSILFQQVISGYIYVLTDSNQPVGIVKGIQGITQLLFSLPAGYFADHTRRDRVLQISGGIGLVASLLTFLAVEYSDLRVIYIAFALWGLFAAFQSPAMEALFADSIPHGRRSLPFTIKYNVSNLAMVMGPFLSILLFIYVGDYWRVQELRPVLIFGTILAAIASLFLFGYDDDLALPEEEVQQDEEDQQLYQSQQYHQTTATVNPLHHSQESPSSLYSVSSSSRPSSAASTRFSGGIHQRPRLGSEPLRTPSVVGTDLEIEYDFSDVELDEELSYLENQRDKKKKPVLASEQSALIADTALPSRKKLAFDVHAKDVRFLCFTTEHVPWLLFISDFIISNGAGMTINFFPLFFMTEYALTPIQVSLLFLVQPLVVMILSFLSQWISKPLGRMPIIVSTRIASTFCLLAMAFAQPLHLQIALFLMRGGMMRCSQPLRRSVLMDFVRKEVRARWNALESISVFSYSGSAVLGGYLVDRYDYRMCFFITSFVYFLGLSLELVLLPLTKHAVEQ